MTRGIRMNGLWTIFLCIHAVKFVRRLKAVHIFLEGCPHGNLLIDGMNEAIKSHDCIQETLYEMDEQLAEINEMSER